MKLKLSIEDPCNENWDEMKEEFNSRFCSKCSKNVKDFTKMKEEEIHRYLKENKKDKICGRFYSEQLGIIEYNEYKENFNTHKPSVIKNLTFYSAVALTSAAISLSSCNNEHSQAEKIKLQDSNNVNRDLDIQNRKLIDISDNKNNLQKENKEKYDLENPNKDMLDRADSIAGADNFKKNKDKKPKINDTTIIVKGGLVMGGIRTNEDKGESTVLGKLKLQEEDDIIHPSKFK